MMKRYISILIALVAIATEANARDLGFKIGEINYTTDNYESESSGKPWYYDLANNVLHFTKGYYRYRSPYSISTPTASLPFLTIDGSVNPTLKISVDGDFTIEDNWNTCIFFSGNGQHVIYGTGSFTMSSCEQAISIPENAGTNLTIKDVSLYISAFRKVGIFSGSSSSITIDNCEMMISTMSGVAWDGRGTVTVKRCHPTDCYIDNRGAYTVESDRLKYVPDATIKRSLWDFNLTVNEPVAGGTVSNSCQFNGTGCEVAEVKWNKLLTGGNASLTMNEGSEFQPGFTYNVYIRILANDGEKIASRDDCVATINGKPAEIINSGGDYITIMYSFQIPDTFYDLWVSDQQVKESNRNALPTTLGTCSYDPVTKTLTLNSAQITNTDYNIEGTVTGFGVYSNIDGLKINVVGNNYINSTHWVGLFSMRNLTITGNGKLLIEANSGGTGLAMGSYGYKLNISGGVKVDAYGGYGVTGGIHTVNVGGEELVESYVTTLSVSSPDAELRAYGTQQCVKTVAFLGEGMEYVSLDHPNVQLDFRNYGIYYYESDRHRYLPYSNAWIIMTNPNGGISTSLEAIDNGELTIDSSLPLYNLHGQRVSHPVKGQIYIQNGRKVKF